MGKFIIKLTDRKKVDWYMEWSTMVDAPVTYGMSLDEFKEYYQEEYGRAGMENLPRRLARVEEKGTSALEKYVTPEYAIRSNRIGDGGKRLTKAQIIKRYCHERP